jgi:hypothetical protein
VGKLTPGRMRNAGIFPSQDTPVLYYVILLTGACLVALNVCFFKTQSRSAAVYEVRL